jgi:hypothetical protein
LIEQGRNVDSDERSRDHARCSFVKQKVLFLNTQLKRYWLSDVTGDVDRNEQLYAAFMR